MGFLFKSAVGLGVVYFAMYGQAMRAPDLGAQANACAAAVQANLNGAPSLRAQWQAASCAASVGASAQRLSASLQAASSLSAPAKAPAAKVANGTLTEADLAEPWFGPTRIPRKRARG